MDPLWNFVFGGDAFLREPLHESLLRQYRFWMKKNKIK